MAKRTIRAMSPDDSPDSPLSSVESSDHYDEGPDDADEVESRPSKRQKFTDEALTPITAGNGADADAEPEHEVDVAGGAAPNATEEDVSDVSDDTDGDIPYSPNFTHTRYEEEDFQEQVTSCAWDGCDAGDVGNMDNLVEHIHNEHIESRQKRYTCEWIGCARKGMAHASGYALKAHMRSHTKEKPFHCYLPECDRAFTRSDALAKHMRTVHETEALRPSDPVPKSMQGPATGKPGKLKIILKTPQSHSTGNNDTAEDEGDTDSDKEPFTPLSEELFNEKERQYPLKELYARCRIQVRLAEQMSEQLAEEIKDLERQYKQEWLEKEALLTQTMDTEMDWHKRRAAITSGTVSVQVSKT